MIRILFSLALLSACTKQAAPTTPAPTEPPAAPAIPPVTAAGEFVGVLARAKILPGKEEELFAALRETAAAVEQTEPDTRVYLFFRSKKDPQELVIFEVYTSKAALDAHNKSAALAALGPKLPGLIDMATLKIEHTDASVIGFLR